MKIEKQKQIPDKEMQLSKLEARQIKVSVSTLLFSVLKL
jgi:hypothetical protein